MRFASESLAVRARIAGGGSRGILELSIDGGRWDGVCDDGFGDSEADAFCAMLGYGDGVGAQYDATHQNSFAVDDIRCAGSGICATDNAPYTHDCDGSEAVGLDCSAGNRSDVGITSTVGFDTCSGCGAAMVMKESWIEECFASPHACDFRNACEP